MERKAAEARRARSKHGKDAKISKVGEEMQTRRKGRERRVGSVREGFRESWVWDLCLNMGGFPFPLAPSSIIGPYVQIHLFQLKSESHSWLLHLTFQHFSAMLSVYIHGA
jgi:hypothetical protein